VEEVKEIQESPDSADNEEMPQDWPQGEAPAAGSPDGFLEMKKQ
jgi:hypothetical protein